jgi:hypothetical protein
MPKVNLTGNIANDRPARLNPTGENILILNVLERITIDSTNAIKDINTYKKADI